MENLKTYKKLTEEMVLKAIEEVQKKYKKEDLFVFFPLDWKAQREIDNEMLKQLRKNL